MSLRTLTTTLFGTAFAGSIPASSAAATPPPSPTTTSELRSPAATLQEKNQKKQKFQYKMKTFGGEKTLERDLRLFHRTCDVVGR